MAGNVFGDLFKIMSFGESHGRGIGVVVDGCPSGMSLCEEDVMSELLRRRPAQSKFVSRRKERDKVNFFSGVFEGKTLGSPIMMMCENIDAKSSDYSDLKDIYRPSHADMVYDKKYGVRDWRGGGRASARETWARVAGGAVAQKFLGEGCGMEFLSFVEQVGSVKAEVDIETIDRDLIESSVLRCPDISASEKMEKLILEVMDAGDSVGGVVKGVIKNVPVGLGEPVYSRLEAELAKAMLSINAVKGFDVGKGFDSLGMLGSEHNDQFLGSAGFGSNNGGGIAGGISTGQTIYFRVLFKPTPTILMEQNAMNADGKVASFMPKGRHDPCVLPRAVSVVDAMAALVMINFFLINRAYIF